MAYKTILLHWDPQSEDGPGPAAAATATLAERFDAHVVVLGVGVEPGIAAYGFGGPGAAAIALQSEAAEAEAEERRAAAAAWLAEAKLPGEARALTGPVELLSDSMARAVRLVDLVVLPAPYASPREDVSVGLLEAALFDGSAAVLVCPETLPETLGEKIVMAWDGGLEALHALRAAMSFLAGASRVEIALIDPEEPAEGEEAPGSGVATFLRRHGVAAEIAAIPSEGRTVGATLAAHMQSSGADLLVMGAYGHSRLREALIGGPTRELLKTVPCPVLMAH